MGEQERLLKEINALSDSIRKKNRALRMGISEREKYLETTFKPVIQPLKELVQGVSQPNPPTDGDLILPLPKYEKYESDEIKSEESETTDEDRDQSVIDEEEETLTDPTDVTKRADDSEQTEEEGEESDISPSNISKLGLDIALTGVLGRKYLLKMLHSTPVTKKYHVYGARLDEDGLKIGNKNLNVDEKDNILIGEKKYKGTKGLFELIFKTKPENYTRTDLKTFREICLLTNAHRKSYAPDAPMHKNVSLKYKNIISQLFLPRSSQLKRKATSTEKVNISSKRNKTGEGLLKNVYSTNIIYYNNINKLVTRMRLLYEAMESGHTGLDNEWVALTAELRNKGVIE